ncbi:MAG: hypothetical protein V4508_24260 [Pseudomonadota bacterium]
MATPEQNDVENFPPLSASGVSRRRFARIGAGASGVLLTLASQPGMACDICTSPSGSLSGGLASHGPTQVACNGVSPGYWKNNDPWPIAKTTKFGSVPNQVFTCISGSFSNYGSCELGGLIDGKGWDNANLGMHLTAAYLNFKSGRAAFPTETMLHAMWYEFQSVGYYKPTATVKWYADDIVNYLKGTMS